MSARDLRGLARALLFNIVFYGWTFLYGFFALLFLAAPRALALPVAVFWNRSAIAITAAVAGIKLEVKGRENIPANPAVFAIKHQSAFETIALPVILDDPIFVMKRELFRIPIYGWYFARLGNIGIDRGGGPSAIKTIVRRAERALQQGHSILIFPEGTRVAPGAKGEYGPGVAALYTMLHVPVVPVAVNSGLFWGRRSFVKNPGTVTIAFLPAIAPGMERQAFMAELERRIETVTGRLIAAARVEKTVEKRAL
jgi:1-acyl-sn-glycerol-3-phosphate acyltransferase